MASHMKNLHFLSQKYGPTLAIQRESRLVLLEINKK
jgi:hypothetical protein